MLFKRFRRFVRANARRKHRLRDIEREREAERSRWEFEWTQKIEAEKDEAFESIRSAFTIGQLGFQPNDAETILLRDCLFLNGWSHTPLSERMMLDDRDE